jgi:DNA-binding CsgD family transcriptional regulator
MIDVQHKATTGVFHDNSLPAGAKILQPAWCQNCFKLTPALQLKKGISVKKYCDRCASGCLAQELEALFLFAEARQDMQKFVHRHVATKNDLGNRRSETLDDRQQHRGHQQRPDPGTYLTRRQLEVLGKLREGRSPQMIARDLSIAPAAVYSISKTLQIKLSKTSLREALEIAFQTGLVAQLLAQPVMRGERGCSSHAPVFRLPVPEPAQETTMQNGPFSSDGAREEAVN